MAAAVGVSAPRRVTDDVRGIGVRLWRSVDGSCPAAGQPSGWLRRAGPLLVEEVGDLVGPVLQHDPVLRLQGRGQLPGLFREQSREERDASWPLEDREAIERALDLGVE